MSKFYLKDDWKVRYEDLSWGAERSAAVLNRTEGWLDASLPCDVHMPLIAAGVIKEPTEADYSYLCEWMEKKSWWFRKSIHISEDVLKNDVVELVLESLDAEADIFLNGIHLGHHKSAFYPFTLDVKEFLNAGENTLLVRLTSGVEYYSDNDLAALKNFVATEKIQDRGDRGDARRIFVRKPQYVFGWDWGPRVATCGIMKDAWLEPISGIAVRSVSSRTVSVSKDGKGNNAVLEFEVEVENLHPYSTCDGSVSISLNYSGILVQSAVEEGIFRSGLNYLKVRLEVEDARLWWPNGMGEQNLYTVNATAEAGETVYAYPEFKIGIKTLKLDMERLNPSERLFAFEVNGVKVFCKGGNWIPADCIYARVTDEKYDTLISEARNADFNMLRIWGGGIYERDIFYEKCDEYGLLIWHDFMFACALYPDNLEWFLKEAEKEIDYQTRKLRNHTSIAVWSGNNENHWGATDWLVKSGKPPFYGGFTVYNKIAPRIVKQNCPDIPYWNSSPYGGKEPNGNDVGDRHHWHDCMMNPEMEKRITPQEYDKVTSKFVSEYGYVGPCKKSSIIEYHGGQPMERGSRIWQLHNNTFEKDTVAAGIAKHYTDPEALGLDQYLLYAGLCQGLMLGYSLEAIRFKEDCHGALFWMYNDCWGETGWTIIDYYLKRKISYYFVKRAFAPLKIILRESGDTVRVLGINETAEAVSTEVEYGYVSLDGKSKDTRKKAVVLAPRSRSVVLEFEKGDYDFSNGLLCVIPEAASGIKPEVLRQCSFRELKVPVTDLKVYDFRRDGRDTSFKVTSNCYAHAVHFNLDDGIRLSDEYFDLLPGETREVKIYNAAESLEEKDIRLMCGAVR